MSKPTSTAEITPWSSGSAPLSDVDEGLLTELSRMGVTSDEVFLRRLSQAFTWAGETLGDFKLIEQHPRLPAWWSERNNKIFVASHGTASDIPALHFHSSESFPQNCTLFVNGKTDYSILLWGSGSLVYIAPTAHLPAGSLAVGSGFVFLGSQVRSTARLHINCRNGGAVTLTKDVLIGSDVKLLTDDCHAIISLESGSRINPFGGTITIREHVWLCEGALLMGDSYVSPNAVIGTRTFLRGACTPPNSIIAGVPAKLTRTNITWDSRDIAPTDTALLDDICAKWT